MGDSGGPMMQIEGYLVIRDFRAVLSAPNLQRFPSLLISQSMTTLW